MELLLMLATGGLMLAVIGAAVFRPGSAVKPANNCNKNGGVNGSRPHALALDEAYRGGAGASFGRSYIGLEGISNDPLK